MRRNEGRQPKRLGTVERAPVHIRLFATTLFLSAGLLFFLQPMIAKMLLPAFGGVPSVWTTCTVGPRISARFLTTHDGGHWPSLADQRSGPMTTPISSVRLNSVELCARSPSLAAMRRGAGAALVPPYDFFHHPHDLIIPPAGIAR
jgi:hypothetical protein